MRVEGAVTSLSWVPSEAISGLPKLPFATVAHYDEPPPERIGDDHCTVSDLRRGDRFRFANELRAFAEFDADGHVSACGYLGGGWTGSTLLRLGGRCIAIAAVAFQDLQQEPEAGLGWVSFTQTAGGRTGVPAPRTVRRPPFVKYVAPVAWTTLRLTLHADGRVEPQIAGASTFPRHWVYDTNGDLIAKTGTIGFRSWYKSAFGDHTPWGGLDSPAVVTAVETGLERQLSALIMRKGSKPEITHFASGEVLFRQGEEGTDLLLVLDGVIAVERDGLELAQLGPGTITGERATLEGGRRTSTNRAVTDVKAVRFKAESIDRALLGELSTGHRRESAIEPTNGAEGQGLV